MRIRNHIRSNVVGYLALFFAFSGVAYATHPGGANTIDSGDIINGQVTEPDIATNAVRSAEILNDSVAGGGLEQQDLQGSSVGGSEIRNNAVAGGEVENDSLGTADLGPDSVAESELGPDSVDSSKVIDATLGAADLGVDSVGSSEIATDAVANSEIVADSVGSSEIVTGVVGADEMDTVHEHTGAATDVVDGTAHDGIYAPSTSTVNCGTGEDLLSVSVDWTALGGHNEVMFAGVDTITRGEPDSATVRVGYDGGAGPATYQATATCIF